MADMKFQQPNEVKWFGYRPGYNGQQVMKDASAINAEATLYTVPADYVFLLNYLSIGLTSSAGSVLGTVRIYDDVPAIDTIIMRQYLRSTPDIFGRNVSFAIPIELAAGWSIRIHSSAAALTIVAAIHGILIDA